MQRHGRFGPQPRSIPVEYESKRQRYTMYEKRTYGTGINKTLKHPSKVFPQSIPRLLNKGLAARGIPAPIMDRKKSLDARTEAAYCG
jgi:hypothetical protein